jgi:hypothetical protein
VTDKTVSVPVELLQELKAELPITASSEGSIINRLAALIPEEAKVGDSLTEEQIGALPRRSVIIDQDGDVWVVGNDHNVAMVSAFWDGSMDISTEKYDASLANYTPVLLHIGKENV